VSNYYYLRLLQERFCRAVPTCGLGKGRGNEFKGTPLTTPDKGFPLSIPLKPELATTLLFFESPYQLGSGVV
jgi:hypothetical protein